jgi:hypothetical protein
MPKAPAYRQRCFARAWLETGLFAKHRLWFGCSMALVMALAFWKFGSTNLTAANLMRNLTIIVGSYLAAWVLSFIVNIVHAPVLLDHDRANEIAGLTVRLQQAEAVAKENIDRKELENRFAALTQQGRGLVNSVGNCLDAAALSAWSITAEDWKNRVSRELQTVWPTDVAAFQYADANAVAVQGIVNMGYHHETQRRKLTCHLNALDEILKRRL